MHQESVGFFRHLGAMWRGLSGGLLVAAVVAAPWLYGGMRTWAVEWLTWLLGAADVAWLLGALCQRKPLKVPRFLLASGLWLGAIGALGVYLRPDLPPEPFMVEQTRALQEMGPENFLILTPWQEWGFVCAVLGSMLVLADLASARGWWLTFFWSVVLTGTSIAGLGIAQVLTSSDSILWSGQPSGGGYFFATFVHYVPAGAYLNLCWPLSAAAGLGVMFKRRHEATQRWIAVLSVGCVGVAWVGLWMLRSKGAQGLSVLAAFGFLATAFLATRPSAANGSAPSSRRGALGWLVGALLVGALAWSVSQLAVFSTTRLRWQQLVQPSQRMPVPERAAVVWDSHGRGDRLLESNAPTRGELLWDRRLAWGTARRMIATRPWVGFGVRGWTSFYYHFTQDPFLKTFYLYLQFTHQDMLQCLVEWGGLGAAGWVALIGNCLHRGSARLVTEAVWCWEDFQWQRLGLFLALGTLFLHGLFDYPAQVPSLQWTAAVLLALLAARAPEGDKPVKA